jgi:hypothetical protein
MLLAGGCNMLMLVMINERMISKRDEDNLYPHYVLYKTNYVIVFMLECVCLGLLKRQNYLTDGNGRFLRTFEKMYTRCERRIC